MIKTLYLNKLEKEKRYTIFPAVYDGSTDTYNYDDLAPIASFDDSLKAITMLELLYQSTFSFQDYVIIDNVEELEIALN